MNETEIAAALKTEKDAFEKKSAALRKKIDKAKETIRSSESRLAKLQARLERRSRKLTRTYLDLPKNPRHEVATRPRASDFSLDEKVLAFLPTMNVSVITTPLVWGQWNAEQPEEQIGRTTMRGILNRLQQAGDLELIGEGGRGRSNPRRYRLRSVAATATREEHALA